VRAVFDTNIFISALVIPGGRADAALQEVLQGRVSLVISRAIIHEVLAVLARKFGRDAEELSRVAIFLSDAADVVSPNLTIRILRDDPDNRVIECAVAGKADVIVSGDQEMLKLGAHQEIKIISLRSFLDHVAAL
jgi:putative PIN family toxin of toxin-antitoxin system